MDWEVSKDAGLWRIVPRKATDVMKAQYPYSKPTQVGKLRKLRGAR